MSTLGRLQIRNKDIIPSGFLTVALQLWMSFSLGIAPWTKAREKHALIPLNLHLGLRTLQYVQRILSVQVFFFTWHCALNKSKRKTCLNSTEPSFGFEDSAIRTEDTVCSGFFLIWRNWSCSLESHFVSRQPGLVRLEYIKVLKGAAGFSKQAQIDWFRSSLVWNIHEYSHLMPVKVDCILSLFASRNVATILVSCSSYWLSEWGFSFIFHCMTKHSLGSE